MSRVTVVAMLLLIGAAVFASSVAQAEKELMETGTRRWPSFFRNDNQTVLAPIINDHR